MARRAPKNDSIAEPTAIRRGSSRKPAASQKPTGRPASVNPTGTAMLAYPAVAAVVVPKLYVGVTIAS